MTLPTYEVFAIRYGMRDARRRDHFIGGDPHDAPMPMDYFVWLVRNGERFFLIDTGFDAAVAAKRKRTIAHLPKKTRTALGKQAAKVAKRKRQASRNA